MNLLMTPAEVAEFLGVSERVVIERARSFANGNAMGLRGFKIARQWRFREIDVVKFTEAHLSPEPLDIPRRRNNWRTA